MSLSISNLWMDLIDVNMSLLGLDDQLVIKERKRIGTDRYFRLWIFEMLTQQKKNTDFAPESSDWSCLT